MTARRAPLPLSAIVPTFSPGFDLYGYQREIFDAIENNQRVAIVASRQIGKTETLLRFALAWAMVKRNQLILIVSAGERQASEVLTRLKAALRDQKYTEPLGKDSATEVKLDNGSRIISLPNSPKTVRGYPANLLLVDETDSIDDWDEFIAALWPSVSRTNGKIVCSGTYLGKRQLYRLTQDPKWVTKVFPYTVNPPADIEQQRHDLTPSKFAQEYDCIAVDAAGTLFPFETIEQCVDKSLRQISRPIGNAIYFAGYDPAKLADPSIVQVLEHLDGDHRTRLVQTHDLGGQDYSIQAAEIKGLNDLFQFVRVCVDQTGTGGGPFEIVQGKIGSRAVGITFTRATKERLINNLRIAFQDRLILIPDDPILKRELHDLDPQTLDHKSGGTSDRCWALALAWDAYLQSSEQLRLGNALVVSLANLDADSHRDIGFISLGENGYWSISRLWLADTGQKTIVEVWRRQTHAQDAIENYYRLHSIRPYEVAGIDQALYDQYQSEFEVVNERHVDDKNPPPLWPIELSSNRTERQKAALLSGIATKTIAFADHLPNNGSIWSQIINLQSADDDARDSISGAVTLAQQSL